MRTKIQVLFVALALIPMVAAIDEAVLLRELEAWANAKQEIFC